jgi:hypothetical protein
MLSRLQMLSCMFCTACIDSKGHLRACDCQTCAANCSRSPRQVRSIEQLAEVGDGNHFGRLCRRRQLVHCCRQEGHAVRGECSLAEFVNDAHRPTTEDAS